MNKLSILLCLFLFALTQCVTQNAVVNCAKKQFGKPYAAGAAGPDKFDSSGLAYYCHNKAIPRASIDQLKGNGKKISKDNVEPGDLMFWNLNGNGVIHTTICVGDGYMIDVPNKLGDKVIVIKYKDNRYWEKVFVGVRRYWS